MSVTTTATALALEAIGQLLEQPGRLALTRAEVKAVRLADGACDRALHRLRNEGRNETGNSSGAMPCERTERRSARTERNRPSLTSSQRPTLVGMSTSRETPLGGVFNTPCR